MFAESIDTDLLVTFAVGLSCLLFLVYLDRRLTRRRSLVANTRHVAWMDVGRGDARWHRMGAENRRLPDAWLGELILEPEIQIQRPGFLSRRQVVTDRVGRVVATHYEELVLADRHSSVPARLMLASGNA